MIQLLCFFIEKDEVETELASHGERIEKQVLVRNLLLPSNWIR